MATTYPNPLHPPCRYNTIMGFLQQHVCPRMHIPAHVFVRAVYIVRLMPLLNCNLLLDHEAGTSMDKVQFPNFHIHAGSHLCHKLGCVCVGYLRGGYEYELYTGVDGLVRNWRERGERERERERDGGVTVMLKEGIDIKRQT